MSNDNSNELQSSNSGFQEIDIDTIINKNIHNHPFFIIFIII